MSSARHVMALPSIVAIQPRVVSPSYCSVPRSSVPDQPAIVMAWARGSIDINLAFRRVARSARTMTGAPRTMSAIRNLMLTPALPATATNPSVLS